MVHIDLNTEQGKSNLADILSTFNNNFKSEEKIQVYIHPTLNTKENVSNLLNLVLNCRHYNIVCNGLPDKYSLYSPILRANLFFNFLN